jgi:hypothetical protein
MNNPELIAPCGIYCGVCPQLIAYKNNNDRLKEKLSASFGIKPEEIVCEGCTSETPFLFCVSCGIKSCVQEKEIESCAECDNFPCDKIENFPVKKFVEKITWDVNYRRQHGKDSWISKTIEINSCPSCQTLNHWIAKRCLSCKNELPERY